MNLVKNRILLAGLLFACAQAVQSEPVCVTPADGIGGSGYSDGISGTGAPARNDTDGIGGTGQQASQDEGIGGTGIQGVITGFASVCLNGLEVHTPAQTPVSLLGQTASLADLRVGQVVNIHAVGSPNNLHARQVEVLHAAVGSVERTAVPGQLRVMGQAVRLSDETRFATGLSPATLAQGGAVRVSGLRAADGSIHATRLDRASAQEPFQLSGLLRIDAQGSRIDGIPVKLPRTALPLAGREIVATGRWDGKQLHADRIAPESGLDLTRVERFSIQGLADRPDTATSMEICGQRFLLTADTRFIGGRAALNDPVRISGHVDKNGRLIAEKVERQSRIMDNRLLPFGVSGKHGRSDSNSGRDEDEDHSGSSGSGSGRSGSSGSGDRDSGSDRSGSGDRSGGSDRSGSGRDTDRPERDSGRRDSGGTSGGDRIRIERIDRSGKGGG